MLVETNVTNISSFQILINIFINGVLKQKYDRRKLAQNQSTQSEFLRFLFENAICNPSFWYFLDVVQKNDKSKKCLFSILLSKNTNRFATDQLLTKRQHFIINNYQKASKGVYGR